MNTLSTFPALWLTVMGVAGCGKSTLAQALSLHFGLPFVEGDEFHSEQNIQKMRQGIALTDEDRASWLQSLCVQLQSHPQGAVMSCSALKRNYRHQLRAAVPSMRFIFLEITPALASDRVQARASDHIFPSSLVQSQFNSLETPQNEPDILKLQADQSTSNMCQQISEWLTSHAMTR